LVVTNAIYFNSNWVYQFDKANTRDLPFYSGLNEYKLTPMMTRTGSYLYGANSELQWIKMPYNIPNTYMIVLLPRENVTFTQLEELEKSLTPESLTIMLSRMRSTRVNLQFPRFRNEQEFSLKAVLSALGMPRAFNDYLADFRGIMDLPEGLYIGRVIHKAFIEVDEEGTEAAAATAIVMQTRSARPDPVIEFNANRPFIYFIYDELTGVILFMGRKIEA
jgi:serpin B